MLQLLRKCCTPNAPEKPFFFHIPSQWPLLQYKVSFCSSLMKFLLVTSFNALSQFFFIQDGLKVNDEKEKKIFCARCKRTGSKQAMLKEKTPYVD